MRVKIIVVLIVLIALEAVILGYLFIKYPLPAYHPQFSLNRQHIAKDMPPALLLPEHIGDFTRTDITPIVVDDSGDLKGDATYENTLGKRVSISVDKSVRGVKGFLPLQSDNMYYDNHLDGEFPYAYSGSHGVQDYIWINGDWMIVAETLPASLPTTDFSTLSTDQFTQFVNDYSF